MLTFFHRIFSLAAEYKIVPKDGPPSATSEQKKVVYVFFWGLRKPIISPLNCRGNGFASVTVRRTLWQIVISLVTLGLISPLTIAWECAKDNCFRDQ